MIDVLEEAGLVRNVFKGYAKDNILHLKFTLDEKTGCKIAGVLGKKGTLEKGYYERLDIESLEKESGKKIFMFHSAIKELMPNDYGQMDSLELSSLPKGFEYYAGGHVHIIKEFKEQGYKNIIYPGPVFPANFIELEKLGCGGFFIYEDGKITREDINIKNTFCAEVNAEHKSPQEVESEIYEKISGKQFLNTIVLIKVFGKLKSGKASDIKMKELFEKIYTQGAYYIMKSTSRVVSEEYEEIRIDEKNFEDVEDALMKEHLGQIKIKGMTQGKEYEMTKNLISAFSQEKHEGEKVYEYEDRIKKEVDRLLEL